MLLFQTIMSSVDNGHTYILLIRKPQLQSDLLFSASTTTEPRNLSIFPGSGHSLPVYETIHTKPLETKCV